MNFILSFKKVTSILAVAGSAVLTWAFSDQGQQILSSVYHAYPKLTVISSVLGFLGILLHSPKAPVKQ